LTIITSIVSLSSSFSYSEMCYHNCAWKLVFLKVFGLEIECSSFQYAINHYFSLLSFFWGDHLTFIRKSFTHFRLQQKKNISFFILYSFPPTFSCHLFWNFKSSKFFVYFTFPEITIVIWYERSRIVVLLHK